MRAALGAAGAGKRLSLLTLTVRHGAGDRLKPLIARLMKGWAALRRLAPWKAAVRGGAFILEVKHNAGRGGWHPHLHVVLDAAWIDHRWLKAVWRRLAGCQGVRIEAVRSADGVGRYLAGYVTKQFDGSVYRTHETLVECMRALRGARTIGTFGDWVGVELEGEEEAFDAAEWRPLARLDDVLALAEEGAPHALRILARLRGEGEPAVGGIIAEGTG